MRAIRQCLRWLGAFVAAASTFLGTCVAYILFRVFILRMDFHWWADLPIAVGFYVVWHWGGYFMSAGLVWLAAEQDERPETPETEREP